VLLRPATTRARISLAFFPFATVSCTRSSLVPVRCGPIAEERSKARKRRRMRRPTHTSATTWVNTLHEVHHCKQVVAPHLSFHVRPLLSTPLFLSPLLLLLLSSSPLLSPPFLSSPSPLLSCPLLSSPLPPLRFLSPCCVFCQLFVACLLCPTCLPLRTAQGASKPNDQMNKETAGHRIRRDRVLQKKKPPPPTLKVDSPLGPFHRSIALMVSSQWTGARPTLKRGGGTKKVPKQLGAFILQFSLVPFCASTASIYNGSQHVDLRSTSPTCVVKWRPARRA
jgi:hypothetical protein